MNTGLPVEEVIGALKDALRDKGAAVLQAPPGAGKTTVVPLRLLDEPWLLGRILVLEPRRLATRAAARRMASLLDEPVGATVGYTTRDERHVSAATRIEVVTEGILTRRLQHDRTLPGVALVVFDEIHERNLHTDLALALTLHSRRDDLRLLAMSATIDTARIAALLNDAPVISSEGRQYPVDVRWAPPRPKQRLAEATTATISRALREQGGDILVFLPGAGDIRRVERLLDGADMGPGVVVRPLFGALPLADQDLALAPSPPGTRRIVLSTDIAETSLTVQGVRTVVDAGQARIPRYDARTGLSKLQTVTASRASADQRAGRAGRTEPGAAYRLWSKMEHAARRPFAAPEIELVDLTGLALELAVWGADAADLAFLDPPPQRALDEGRDLLRALGALDDGRPTDEGRAMAELPLHPRLARMVTGAHNFTACAIAALLEDRDVLRGTPDEVPVDIAERVRLISDRHATPHPLTDRAALASARRRAAELARRIGLEAGRDDDVDLRCCGRVLALAYPDRIGQARGGARFRLRNGAGAWVPKDDPLATEAFLVVAELDADKRDSRVRMAAALDAADLEEAAGAPAQTADDVAWDPATGEFRRTLTTRIDGLVLGTTAQTVAAGTGALVEHIRANGVGVLPWTDTARALQHRIAFLRRTFGDEWPDLSDGALVATVETWLTADSLKKVDVVRTLRTLLGHRPDLDRLAPTTLTVASGRQLPIDYRGEDPKAAGRVQDFFGTTTHPTVAGGRIPLTLELLSPANRPVQVTADLPGFWAGSYAAVRKDMAGRYPKHPWPEDPANATATTGRGRKPPAKHHTKPHRRRR